MPSFLSQLPSAAGVATLAAGLCAAVLLARAALRLRASTLSAPANWAAATLLAWSLLVGWSSWQPVGDVLHYAASVGLFCPVAALLGAKRPQDVAWQWIVAAFWMTLLVPAAHAAFTGVGVQLHAAWCALIWGVWGMGLANFLPTRFGGAALLAAAGQLSATSPFLLGVESVASAPVALLSIWLMFAAVGLAHGIAWRPITPGWHGVWIDFRSEFGAVWGLRVSQRFNDAAERADWPLRLTWFGFTTSEGGALTDVSLTEPQAESLRGALRRFVSEDWMTARLGDASESASTLPGD